MHFGWDNVNDESTDFDLNRMITTHRSLPQARILMVRLGKQL